MKFSGNNFQAWHSFDLEITGLTVVTGVSNKGKSALFRALQGLLRNELSASYVRNGQKKPLALKLVYNNHEIVAERARDGSSKYLVDGKAFAKLAGQIPEDLKTLGFGEVKIGEFAVDPIFSVQNEPQFLLDKKTYSPSMLNAILGAFGGTEKLEAGKKEANLRVTHKNGEAKTLSFEIAEAEQRRAALEALTVKSGRVASEVHHLESLARSLEHRTTWTTLAHYRLQRLSPLLQILELLKVPDTGKVERLQTVVVYLNVLGHTQFAVSALDHIESQLSRVTPAWSEIVRLYKKIQALQETLPLKQNVEAATGASLEIVDQVENDFYTAVNLRASISYIAEVHKLLATVEDLAHQRLHIEQEQDAATKLKCPQCGTEI
jgi:energy-coupling factor transporter ATP-binding protein EcfA2